MRRNLPELYAKRNRPFAAVWLIDAPWAHLAWSQYTLALYDLTTSTAQRPVIHMLGATHEMVLWALDPAHRVDVERPASQQTLARLTPAKHGYQFQAKSDEAAVARLQSLVDAIEARTLSPDTDFRRMWDARFTDGHTLLRSACAA